MPLESGKSKAAFSHNVEVEIAAGKKKSQAVAIAYAQKRKGKDSGPDVELEEAIEAGEAEGKHQRAALREMEIDCEDAEADKDDDWDVEALDELPPELPRMAFDRGSLRTKDANGFMHVRDCRISKANICPYLGREIPDSKTLGLDDERIYNLYRDASSLAAAAPTFERVPLMMHHVGVSADSPQKQLTIGTVSNVRWQAPYLVADLTVWDAAGIEAIESERQQELSPGYYYRPEMNSGVLDGKTFDGRMLDIRANHLAIVDTGRTGADVVVNDRAPSTLQ